MNDKINIFIDLIIGIMSAILLNVLLIFIGHQFNSLNLLNYLIYFSLIIPLVYTVLIHNLHMNFISQSSIPNINFLNGITLFMFVYNIDFILNNITVNNSDLMFFYIIKNIIPMMSFFIFSWLFYYICIIKNKLNQTIYNYIPNIEDKNILNNSENIINKLSKSLEDYIKK